MLFLRSEKHFHADHTHIHTQTHPSQRALLPASSMKLQHVMRPMPVSPRKIHPPTYVPRQASTSKAAAPESARGRLKSCLSSRKRSRGGGGAGGAGFAATPGDRTSPSSHVSPDGLTSADSVAGGALSPSARPLAAAGGAVKTPGTAGGGGGGGRTTVPDVGLETPRRVMFGAPMAAEFNHTSPSNRLTPMPSRDAKVKFVIYL